MFYCFHKKEKWHDLPHGACKSHQDICSFPFLCLERGFYRQNETSFLVSAIASSFSFLLPCTKLNPSYVGSCLKKQWKMLVSASKSTRGLDPGLCSKVFRAFLAFEAWFCSYFNLFHPVLASVQLIIGIGGDVNFALTHQAAQRQMLGVKF